MARICSTQPFFAGERDEAAISGIQGLPVHGPIAGSSSLMNESSFDSPSSRAIL
jgi:hypothetical protein